MEAEQKLERILGSPSWQTLTAGQVVDRAHELQKATDFVWALRVAMFRAKAENVGEILSVHEPPAS